MAPRDNAVDGVHFADPDAPFLQLVRMKANLDVQGPRTIDTYQDDAYFGLRATSAELDASQKWTGIYRPRYSNIRGDGTGKDWDTNWLMVVGDAVDDDERTWSFRDPCLTTWEARRLRDWLRGVVNGSVLSSPFDGSEAERLLFFTEPNLASRGRSIQRCRGHRVHLSLESRPPRLSEPDNPDIVDYFLLARMRWRA